MPPEQIKKKTSIQDSSASCSRNSLLPGASPVPPSPLSTRHPARAQRPIATVSRTTAPVPVTPYC
jgi:hypothetical protein